MFTFGLAMGVRHGWLPEADYKAAAKKGWEALAKHLNAEGLVTDVCVGTGAGPSQQFYLARQRLVGDFHGQAAFSWAAWAMMQ